VRRRRARLCLALAAGVAVAGTSLATTGRLPVAGGDGGDAGGRAGHASSHAHALGGVEWSTPVTGWPFALAADRDLAVVVAGRGAVTALGVEHGRTRWTASVDGAGLEAPALDARTVLVAAGERVVALDRDRGRLRWERAVPGRASAVALAAHGDGSALAIVTTEDGAVAAFDLPSSAPRWHASFPGPIVAPPGVDPATATVAVAWHGQEPRLRVLDLATGAMRWEALIPAGSTAPVAAAGLVITGEGGEHGHARVVARDAGTGAERWALPTPASFEPSVTPVADHDAVAVVDHFGTVTMVGVPDGAARWQARLDEPVLRTAVQLTARRVVLTTHSGKVAVLDRRTGAIVRRAEPGGFPVGFAVAGPRLLVALRLTEPGRVESGPLE
jgi:outer membrane protein assembly factor BamB